MKFKVNKFSKFQNEISDSIFFSYENQIIQLENYVENIIQGEAHKVLQSDSTQTINHIQKCFR